MRRFVTLLSDLGKNQLGLDIRKERDRFGSYFVGLKIRDVNDREPPLITGNAEVTINVSPKLENTNVINKVWAVVMNKVTDMIDYAMGESIGSDECDECVLKDTAPHNGIFKKSSKIKNNVESKVNCNMEDEGNSKKEIILDKISQMPSHPSHPSHKQANTKAQQKVKDSRVAITIGDKVTVNDCPAYWSWASPFTVEAIDGEMVKLEMVKEMVEIERLLKCQISK